MRGREEEGQEELGGVSGGEAHAKGGDGKRVAKAKIEVRHAASQCPPHSAAKEEDGGAGCGPCRPSFIRAAEKGGCTVQALPPH